MKAAAAKNSREPLGRNGSALMSSMAMAMAMGKGVRSGTSGQLPSHGGNRTCRHKEAANAIRCAHSLNQQTNQHRSNRCDGLDEQAKHTKHNPIHPYGLRFPHTAAQSGVRVAAPMWLLPRTLLHTWRQMR